MACAIRIAASTAKLGQPEVNLGLIPGFGGSQRLIRLSGKAVALDLCLSGQPIDAARALSVNLVTRVHPSETLEEETSKLAAHMATLAPLALRGVLDCIRYGAEASLDIGLDYESQTFGLMFATEDMREGTEAFLQRRPAAFAGK
jgi:enoyl-CoA hydratase